MENYFTIKGKNIEDTDMVARAVAAAYVGEGGLVCLYGDIGAGKTTLVKHVASHLDIKEKVTSPSFVILNEYHSGKISLYHFDLYRLEDAGVKSVLDELREYTDAPGALAIVEWAEFSSGELAELDRLEIRIEYVDDEARNFTLASHGKKSQEMLEALYSLLRGKISR